MLLQEQQTTLEGVSQAHRLFLRRQCQYIYNISSGKQLYKYFSEQIAKITVFAEVYFHLPNVLKTILF